MKVQSLSFKIISLPKFPKISLKRFFAFQVILFITLFFLLLINVYLILKESAFKQKYQVEIEKLSKEIETLEITFSKISSFSQLENYFSKEGFVKISPNKIKYLELSSEVLVTEK